jgi:hypothetical protein
MKAIIFGVVIAGLLASSESRADSTFFAPKFFSPTSCADIVSVSTSTHSVTLNGRKFSVRGAPHHGTGNYKLSTTKGLFGGYTTHVQEKTVRGVPYWRQLATMLKACGHDDAAEALRLWRKAHREVVVGWATIYGIPLALVMRPKVLERRAEFEAAFLTIKPGLKLDNHKPNSSGSGG